MEGMVDVSNQGKILVLGASGMVGSAIGRALVEKYGKEKVLLATRDSVDLRNQSETRNFMFAARPKCVFLAAAKVGGIYANQVYPKNFIHDNLGIAINAIEALYDSGCERLINLGSSCIYPCETTQPIPEAALLSGALESTNEPYAVAKIAGIKLCESYNRQFGTDFRSLMPCNLYGPGDNYDPTESHVIPALIRRFHEAKVDRLTSVEVWGSGKVFREFLNVEDLADACILASEISRNSWEKLIESPMCSHVNIGSGERILISDLARMLSDIIGYDGEIVFDESMPDGVFEKTMDITKISSIGWSPKISLKAGLTTAYRDFLNRL